MVEFQDGCWFCGGELQSQKHNMLVDMYKELPKSEGVVQYDELSVTIGKCNRCARTQKLTTVLGFAVALVPAVLGLVSAFRLGTAEGDPFWPLVAVSGLWFVIGLFGFGRLFDELFSRKRGIRSKGKAKKFPGVLEKREDGYALGKPPPVPEPEVPEIAELDGLPAWALVVIVIRCSRRLQPLLEHFLKAPVEDLSFVDSMLGMAESIAATGGPILSEAKELIKKEDFATSKSHFGASDIYSIFSSAACALEMAIKAVSLSAEPERKDWKENLQWGTNGAGHSFAAVALNCGEGYNDLRPMWRDIDRLKKAASEEGWTDRTLVPLQFCGPLWRDSGEGWKRILDS